MTTKRTGQEYLEEQEVGHNVTDESSQRTARTVGNRVLSLQCADLAPDYEAQAMISTATFIRFARHVNFVDLVVLITPKGCKQNNTINPFTTHCNQPFCHSIYGILD